MKSRKFTPHNYWPGILYGYVSLFFLFSVFLQILGGRLNISRIPYLGLLSPGTPSEIHGINPSVQTLSIYNSHLVNDVDSEFELLTHEKWNHMGEEDVEMLISIPKGDDDSN